MIVEVWGPVDGKQWGKNEDGETVELTIPEFDAALHNGAAHSGVEPAPVRIGLLPGA